VALVNVLMPASALERMDGPEPGVDVGGSTRTDLTVLPARRADYDAAQTTT
jgi:hypothetical protein